MKEISFIRQNIEKWKSLERIADDFADCHPNEIADAYIVLSGDLSFSRSHYPKSRITVYLNNLASSLHTSLHQTKKEQFSRIRTFWTQEVPDVMYQSRKELACSFLVFLISAFIGVISAANDDSFVRLIMGNGYVDMTLDNIKAGDPAAVYKQDSSLPMFLGITFNNIRVSFLAFVTGVFTFLGTGYLLFRNGIMIGAFQTFTFQYDVGVEWSLALWCHGVFEMSAIIIAGAAGFALSSGWLFPDSYPRAYAFRRDAKRGLKIITGLIPVFVMAGFIESFITRHTEFPTAVRASIILLSLFCVIYYYLLLPFLRARTASENKLI